MRGNENEMRMRWNNKAWLVRESGLRRYQSWDSSWCSYVKPDLQLRGIPATSTIRPTSALRTIVIIFSQKEQQGPARASLRPGPAQRGPLTVSIFQARPGQGFNMYHTIWYKMIQLRDTVHEWNTKTSIIQYDTIWLKQQTRLLKTYLFESEYF